MKCDGCNVTDAGHFIQIVQIDNYNQIYIFSLPIDGATKQHKNLLLAVFEFKYIQTNWLLGPINEKK